MATELAKAYVQILPSARGMKDNLTKMLDNEMPSGDEPGQKLGESLVGGIKKVIVAAGIGKIIKDSLSEGAALEQSVGGVETLFKDSADTVIKNAEKAYQSAGLSANEYMETVTSFSAGLIQSLGRDVQTDLDEMQASLDASYDKTKRAYEDQYKEAQNAWAEKIKLAQNGAKESAASLKEQQTAELKALKERIKASNGAEKEALQQRYDAVKQSWADRIQAVKDGGTETADALKKQRDAELLALKRSNEDRLKQLKSANKAELEAAKTANNASKSTSESIALAAEIADMAIIDMSDNANKMGTSMESIQNAYQGFAKQNYTMLDNLKLGYGGIKEEMERLLEDAQRISGVKYDINNLGDVYQAIHVVQEEMGITGTTAEEAASTFSGSMASMKASTKNLLGALASGKDVEKATDTFIKTAETFLGDNFIPMLGRILNSAGKFIGQAIRSAPEFLSDLVKELDFESAATLFATLSAPKMASKLLSTFTSDSGVKNNLKKAGDAIGDTIGDGTVGKADGIASSFSTKFSKGLSAASSVISAAIISWDIGTMIYNCAKPWIDKITDALVNAFHTDEDVELDDKLMEANAKWQVAELKQKGATWLTSADAGNQAVLDRAAKIINQAARWKDYGITPDDFRAAADLTSWDEAVAWFDSKTGMTGINKFTTGARNWGDDLSKNMADGILGGAGAVVSAATSVAKGIKGVLGFSEPEEGPLSDFHTYAPDMMQLFAQGISDNSSLVKNEVISLMSGVRSVMTEPIDADPGFASGGPESRKTIIMRLVDNFGRIIAEGTVEDIDELQGASVILSERGLAR